MDKKTIYEKAEKAFNQAFEATKQSAKVVSEKAGEAAHVTKLLINKATLEHRVTKQFAQLGNRVYEKTIRAGQGITVDDAEIKSLIDGIKSLDSDLGQVEATLEKERKEKGKK